MADTVVLEHNGEVIPYGNDGLVAACVADAPDIVREHGVAVVPNRLTPEECAAMNDGAWVTANFLTSRCSVPVQRDDPRTYASLWELMPSHGMLQQHYGVHAQYLTDLRQNRKLAELSAAYHQCEIDDMLVSFDGYSFGLGPVLPGKKRGLFRGPASTWLHLDQRLSDNRDLCLQTWVTANPVGPGDATLRVLLGSHKIKPEFARHFGLEAQKVDWFMLTREHIDYFIRRGCRDHAVTAPAGSQVAWSSNTVHSGIEAMPASALPASLAAVPRTYRNVAYLCFQPRSMCESLAALQRTIDKRRRIMGEGPDGSDDSFFLRGTSHWPLKCSMFGKTPRTYGAQLPDVSALPPPHLTAYGRRVYGL